MNSRWQRFASCIAILTIGCSTQEPNLASEVRQSTEINNSDLVSSRAVAILKRRSEYQTRRFDRTIRESIIYLCNASGSLATNIREAHLEEILVPELAPQTIGLGCGTQTLINGSVVYGKYLRSG